MRVDGNREQELNSGHQKFLPPYLAGVFVYGLGILLTHYGPFYRSYLSIQAKDTLFFLYLGYILFAPLFHFFLTGKEQENRPFLFLQGIFHLLQRKPLLPSEKTAFLFMGVKLFFIPLMLHFFHQNLQDFLQGSATILSLEEFSFSNLKTIPGFALLLAAIFTLDTALFSFAYLFESSFLRNKVKSVEPTFLGWIVTLVCYPPFAPWLGNFIPWGAHDYADFGNPLLTAIMRIIIVVLFLIYLAATLALGFKASNLTNRGIVTRFPYSIVRHPAYVSKLAVWWLTLLPVMNLPFFLGMLFWTFMYYLRASTEEHHLSSDAEYRTYKEKVKWRFVPKLR